MEKNSSSIQADAAVFSRLQTENDALKKEVARLREKLERMNELLLNAQRARFGQSSEKQTYVMQNGRQLGLFNEAEAEQVPKEPGPTEETLVKTHTRKPCQRRFKNVEKRRTNFVVIGRRGGNEIKRFRAEKECSQYAVSGA